jgi:hypothetical protein
MTGRLKSGRLSKGEEFPDLAEPRDGVTNMADVMLVLAVGIMLSLVIHWNLDVGNPELSKPKKVDMEQAVEIEGFESEEDIADITSETGLQEKGKIYINPETGKMYMILSE